VNNQISFITAFKKFKGIYAPIQHSALYSWQANDIPVVASENEVGLKEPCQGYSNITLIQGVRRARELGLLHQAPIIRDLIGRALTHVKTPMVALVTPDVIIPGNFSNVLDQIFQKYGFNVFLYASRQDIQLNYPVNSSDTYMAVQKEPRRPSNSYGMFITSKFWWRRILSVMPEFILGRFVWDEWLRMYAEQNIKDRYNASKILTLMHCIHDYNHVIIQEKAQPRKDPSTAHNMKLWGQTRGNYKSDNWKELEI